MEYVVLLVCLGMFILGFAAIINSKDYENNNRDSRNIETTKCTKEDYAYHLNLK